MAILTQDKLLELQQAILSARLDDRRDALLTSIDRRVVAQLPKEDRADAQILEDLDYLSNMGALEDGTYPLEMWLKNAETLASPRHEAALFRAVLEEAFKNDAAQFALIVRGATSDGAPVYLREGTEHVVGRGRRANLAFPEDLLLSKAHARIAVHDQALCVKDLGSKHGVWLNERRVKEARLTVGDVLRCGQTVLVVTEVTTPETGSLLRESPPSLRSSPALHFTI